MTVLRRKRWDNISIEDLKGPNADDDSGEIFSETFSTDSPSPEMSTAQKMMLEKVQDIIQNVLTDKQRKVITALMIHDLPNHSCGQADEYESKQPVQIGV
ncbi:MAG: hypothetical protein U5K69_03730 [Balneolaceae bacterium]|nr:hypothetical protein [Balneolaceae bacterium]